MKKHKLRLLNNIDHNMKYYILNGILFTFGLNLYKPFIVKFVSRLGGNQYHISLINSLPGLIAVFTIIPGILIIRKYTNKKRITAIFFLLSRLTVLLFVLVPLLPKDYQPIIFVIFVAFMNFPESISQTALQSYTGEIFTSKERSTAISSCKKYSVLIQIIIVLISGQILSKIGKTENQIMHIYQIFFVIAFIIGLLEIMTFLKLKSKIDVPQKKIKIKKILNSIFQNQKFWGFTLCSLIFHFGWQMGWPLFSIYQIDYLKADEFWLGMFNVSSSISMFFSYMFWNSKIKTYGDSKVVVLATTGMALNAVVVALSKDLYTMTLLSFISGFFTAGTVTVLLDILLEVTPDENRNLYVGVYNTLINLSLFISPFVGYFILSKTNIYITLYIVAFLRLLGGITFTIRNKVNKGVV